jgi:hypothetical protein
MNGLLNANAARPDAEPDVSVLPGAATPARRAVAANPVTPAANRFLADDVDGEVRAELRKDRPAASRSALLGTGRVGELTLETLRS